MSKSFAGLARTAEKEKSVVAVSKEPLESPPLEIYKLGNRVLRERAKRISKVDESTRELARNMLRSMYSAKGIGLAAPQVGIHKQILVIDLDYENSTSPPIVLINPEIQIFGSSIDTYEEGCLSIPGVYLDVVRPSSVKISYRDEMGRPKKMSADGLLGRCIQHEIDHLNGVLFIDRVKDVEARDNALTEQGYKIEDIKEIK